MGINIINIENKEILAYKIPSFYNNENNLIGNKLEDFEILQIMGEGSFGNIAKVKSKLNSEIYALKQNKLENISKEKKREITNELLFLKKLDHPNICKCITTFEENNLFYIVMKLFDNKDLYRYLVGNRIFGNLINEDIFWNIFYQCINGLNYIHNKGIIHRDIKPGNIFIDDEKNIQIGDFGIAVVMQNSNQVQNFSNDPEQQKSLLLIPGECKGTPNYVAPEVQLCQNYDQKADIYSMGITFYALCYASHPYINNNNMNELNNDNYYSKELRDIICKMIQINPLDRINTSDLYSLIKKCYIKKYVKNSGIFSAVRCLFNYPNFKSYFSNNYLMSQVMESQCPKKFSFIMIEIIQSIEEKIGNNISDKIYDLRNILKETINKKDNEEISPLETINILLNSLNCELNEKFENMTKSQKKSYIHNPDVPGNEAKKYQEFVNDYNKIFNSFISINFQGVLKVARKCSINHINYLFRRFHFIPLNCDIIKNKLKKQTINISEAFDCLNDKNSQLDKNKFVVCPECKKYSQHKVSTTIYKTPDNLIIFFDRGPKNSNNIKIDFDEKITFNKSQVQLNYDKEYYLLGIITEISIQNSNSKYLAFIKKGSNWILCDIEQENNQEEFVDLSQIKNQGNIICLFYYQTFINSVNFGNNINNNLNNNMDYNMNNNNNMNIMNNNMNNNNMNNINNNMNNNMNMMNNINMNNNMNIMNNNNMNIMNNNNMNNMNNNMNNMNNNMNNMNNNMNNMNNNMNNMNNNMNNMNIMNNINFNPTNNNMNYNFQMTNQNFNNNFNNNNLINNINNFNNQFNFQNNNMNNFQNNNNFNQNNNMNNNMRNFQNNNMNIFQNNNMPNFQNNNMNNFQNNNMNTFQNNNMNTFQNNNMNNFQNDMNNLNLNINLGQNNNINNFNQNKNMNNCIRNKNIINFNQNNMNNNLNNFNQFNNFNNFK